MWGEESRKQAGPLTSFVPLRPNRKPPPHHPQLAMAVIQEVYEPQAPQPRYTGPAKPVMRSRNKAAPAAAPASYPAWTGTGLSWSDPIGRVHSLLFDRQHWHILAGLLLLGECILCGLIVKLVGCKSAAFLSPSTGRPVLRTIGPDRVWSPSGPSRPRC